MDDYVTQSNTSASDEPPYGLIERQVAFKLLAAHAMVDREFYEFLRKDPVGAAAQLHIMLNDEDVKYITEIVEWDVIDEHGEPVRQALHTEAVVRSLW